MLYLTGSDDISDKNDAQSTEISTHIYHVAFGFDGNKKENRFAT